MIKPWIGYITVIDVDHEDALRIHEAGLQDVGPFQVMTPEYKIPQGIVAGAVVATGDGVPDIEPGSKVYYSGAAAIVIGEYKVVHTNYVVAYEEAP